MNTKKATKHQTDKTTISLAPLDFEAALEAMLEVSPVKQNDLKEKPKPKKKSAPKKK